MEPVPSQKSVKHWTKILKCGIMCKALIFEEE